MIQQSRYIFQIFKGLSFWPLPRSYLCGDSWLCSNDGARDAGKCEMWLLIAAEPFCNMCFSHHLETP